jgi:hypothetical protein
MSSGQNYRSLVLQIFQTELYYAAILEDRMALSVSQRLGPYEVVAQIGAGGQGGKSIEDLQMSA